MLFKLSTTSLEDINLKDGLHTESTGAFCTFEGLVRNHSNERKVIALEYEALPPLCHKEAEKIFQEAHKQFNILNGKCFHRVGKLDVGDLAVWVGVSAAHRDDAFKACRYIIDEVKARLPIWKKEFFSDGDSGWVNCQNNAPRDGAKTRRAA